MRLWFRVWGIASILAMVVVPGAAAQERANRLISLLESGKPVIGVWTSAIGAPRITKVLATSDVDYIVADVEHEVFDFPTLRNFLLGVQDFSLRYRNQPRSAPVVLVKTGTRGTWDGRYEIAESLKVGPAMGVWLPFVENRADLERAISAVRNAETSALAGLNIPREGRDVWPLNPKGELMVVAMIENEAGVRHAQEILETPGLSAVECVHIPAADEARIVKMAVDRKIVVAADQVTPADVQSKIAAGYRMLSVSWDYGLLQRALTDAVKGLRGNPPTSARR